MYPTQLCVIADGFKNELLEELAFLELKPLYETDLFVALSEDRVEPAWSQCVWRDVRALEIKSIGDAQKKLKAISKTWRYLGDRFNRRGVLITEGLNLAKPTAARKFPSLEPLSVPAFTLLEPGVILYSDQILRPTHDGKVPFIENKTTPPSRAYLKLWEALTILDDTPREGELVVDLGSSPGSWSWALAELGVTVLSVDRSPLGEALHAYSNIQFTVGDAFSFKPRKLDWVFSDVICYPDKLYEYVRTWLASGHCQKFVCSIKFAGAPDYKIIDRFRKLPHSRVLHLSHNKNEVTWICHPRF